MSRSTFGADVSKIAKDIGASIEQTCRAIKIELFTSVIDDTRVDTGRMKGNWQTTAGSPASSDIDRLDPSGVSARQEAQKVQGIGVDYLTNNVPYVLVYEEKDAMVDKNLARISQIVRQKARA